MTGKNDIHVPTHKKCYELLEGADTLRHIKHHCEVVKRVAQEIAQRLNEAGEKIDIDLVKAGALLHDVTKTRSLQTEEDHVTTGAELVRQQGYLEVSELIRQHIQLDNGPGQAGITEAGIVNYAGRDLFISYL